MILIKILFVYFLIVFECTSLYEACYSHDDCGGANFYCEVDNSPLAIPGQAGFCRYLGSIAKSEPERPIDAKQKKEKTIDDDTAAC